MNYTPADWPLTLRRCTNGNPFATTCFTTFTVLFHKLLVNGLIKSHKYSSLAYIDLR